MLKRALQPKRKMKKSFSTQLTWSLSEEVYLVHGERVHSEFVCDWTWTLLLKTKCDQWSTGAGSKGSRCTVHVAPVMWKWGNQIENEAPFFQTWTYSPGKCNTSQLEPTARSVQLLKRCNEHNFLIYTFSDWIVFECECESFCYIEKRNKKEPAIENQIVSSNVLISKGRGEIMCLVWWKYVRPTFFAVYSKSSNRTIHTCNIVKST